MDQCPRKRRTGCYEDGVRLLGPEADGADPAGGAMESRADQGSPPGGAVDEGYCSVAQAAFGAGVSRQAVHDWIRRGYLIPEQGPHGFLRIRRAEVERVSRLRRVASEVGVRLSTIRFWADGATDEAAEDGPLARVDVSIDPAAVPPAVEKSADVEF